MFAYYFALALRSLRRSRVITVLMVLAIGLGIAACMTTLTVYRVLSGDPLPGRSGRLFTVQMDGWSLKSYTPGDPLPTQLTRYDAEALVREHSGVRQALMTGGGGAIEPAQSDLLPFYIDMRYTSADFFPMFDVPFAYGSGWTAADDDSRARVLVLSEEMNQKLFGGQNSVGREVTLSEAGTFRVIGVLRHWRPVPRFYDLNIARFGETEQVFLPFSTSRELKMSRNGSISCRDDKASDNMSLASNCIWMQFWVQLDTPAQVAEYRRYLDGYVARQRQAGRFERPTAPTLVGLMDWLALNHVVEHDAQLQVAVAFGFLLLCLVNTVGLLLAKCLRRAPEIGVRRALGASRRQIFAQFLVEAGVMGLAGGLLGLALSALGLWAVQQTGSSDAAALATLDVSALLINFGLALVASLLAGLLPAWRACQITPALQLKSA